MMAHLHRMNWKRIKETLQAIGAPVTAEEIDIEPEFIIQALVRACEIRPERYTILERTNINYDSAKKLAKATGVIN